MSLILKTLTGKLKGKYIQISQAESRYLEPVVDMTHRVLWENEFLLEPPIESNPRFDVLFVTSASDLKFLSRNIENLNGLYPEINQFIIVTPDASDPQLIPLKARFGVHVFSDYEVAGVELDGILSNFPRNRKGWLTQQFIKTRKVFESDIPILIVDADTFILKQFRWFNSQGSQLLLLSLSDFHLEYNKHYQRVFGGTAPLLNFVTHVQLQFPSVVQSIYGSNLVSGWSCWLEKGRKKFHGSPVSEYQTYGVHSTKIKKSKLALYAPKHLLLSEVEFDDFFFRSSEGRGDWDLVTLVHKK